METDHSKPNSFLLDIALIAAILAIGFGGYALSNQNFGAALPGGPAIFETSLQDRITSSDTTMSLVANSLRGGEAISGYNCFTIDEGRSDSEYVCGTVSGTSVTGLERGLSFSTGTTTLAALKNAHRKGANVKITDFPLIQRMKAVLNGEDTIPNLLTYSSATDCTAGHNTHAICSGTYLENVANAIIAGGSPTSTNTLGGKVLLASQLQMASSTDLGVSAPLVLQAKYATSSPGTAGLFAVITTNAGKIAQSFLDIFSTANTFSLLQTYTLGFISNASSTVNANFTVGSAGVFNVASTSASATSTIGANLTVAKNASTTNLTISGACTGCSGATIVSSAMSNLNGGTPSQSSGSASCTAPKVVSGCGLSPSGSTGSTGGYTSSAYPSSATTCSATQYGSNGSSATPGNSVYAICVNP